MRSDNFSDAIQETSLSHGVASDYKYLSHVTISVPEYIDKEEE